jgi:hyperosmotically inducible protein
MKLAIILSLPLLALALTAMAQSTPQARIERAVQRELIMVPQYGVFDHLTYQVNGDTVTLTGSVTRPVTKTNAERAVKSIEAVSKVDNKITVLPVYGADDAIRLAVYRAVYGTPALERYALQAVPSIHIIVNNGNVTLEGAVGNKGDGDLAAIRAKTVSGVFAVTSHLLVDAPAGKAK